MCWNKTERIGFIACCSFCRMSELIEKETEEYRKGDPDPFDDRHPGKTFGMVLAALAPYQLVPSDLYIKVSKI